MNDVVIVQLCQAERKDLQKQMLLVLRNVHNLFGGDIALLDLIGRDVILGPAKEKLMNQHEVARRAVQDAVIQCSLLFEIGKADPALRFLHGRRKHALFRKNRRQELLDEIILSVL